MKNKAILFDLDGTAVDSPKERFPSLRLKNALKYLENEYFICAATGRSWSFCKHILEFLELTDLCLISGGTQICNPKTGEIVWQKDIEPEALVKVIEVYKRNQNRKIVFNDYTEKDYIEGLVFPADFDCSIKVNWLSQSFIPIALAELMAHEINSIKGVTCVKVNSIKEACFDLHVVHEYATKEQGIGVLLDLLKVKKENTIGIGDGLNDLHLFNAVGKKVAMGNAVPGLKENADIIIDSIKEDGLGIYLETLT